MFAVNVLTFIVYLRYATKIDKSGLSIGVVQSVAPAE